MIAAAPTSPSPRSLDIIITPSPPVPVYLLRGARVIIAFSSAQVSFFSLSILVFPFFFFFYYFSLPPFPWHVLSGDALWSCKVIREYRSFFFLLLSAPFLSLSPRASVLGPESSKETASHNPS